MRLLTQLGCRSSVKSIIMSHHGRGRNPCPLCEDPQLATASVLEHVVDHRREELNLDKEWNVGVLMRTLKERNISLYCPNLESCMSFDVFNCVYTSVLLVIYS